MFTRGTSRVVFGPPPKRSTVHRVLAAEGLVLQGNPARDPAIRAPWPEWVVWKPSSVWCYDFRQGHYRTAGDTWPGLVDAGGGFDDGHLGFSGAGFEVGRSAPSGRRSPDTTGFGGGVSLSSWTRHSSARPRRDPRPRRPSRAPRRRVNRSRSRVGRSTRPCASMAPPPARAACPTSGRVSASRASCSCSGSRLTKRKRAASVAARLDAHDPATTAAATASPAQAD